jgi:PAS domain S-box-containing protein
MSTNNDSAKKKSLDSESRDQNDLSRLAAIVAGAEDAIIGKDLHGVITSWNRGAEKIFGYTTQEAIGKSINLLLPPERSDEESDILRRILKGEQVSHFETERICKNGKRIDISATVSPIFDLGGKVIGASKIARDITSQKKIQQELLVANNKLAEQNLEKAKRVDEPVITNNEKVQRAAELDIANEELAYQNQEKAKRVAELVVANEQKAQRAAELIIANEELAFQNQEKAKRVDELLIANQEKAKRAAELVIANEELIYQSKDKAKRADELIIANEEKAKRAAELVIAMEVKAKMVAELVIFKLEAINNEKLQLSLMETIDIARSLVELRDPYTAGHEKHVGDLAKAIGAEMGLDATHQEGLMVAGYLHDLGKIIVPVEILCKPGKISPEEYNLIKNHVQAGYDLLKGVSFPWPVSHSVLEHHERLDGSGYPKGLKGDQISLDGRIMAVADVMDAMGCNRPYRTSLGIEKALAEIEGGRGRTYDEKVVDACVTLFRKKGYIIPTALA